MMLCLGSYVLHELQEPDFMFLATEPESILGPECFKKGVIKQIFVAKMKKALVIMPQKLLY